MKRYKQVLLSEPYYHSCMRPHEDGDYVRHSDAQAEIAKLAKERDSYAELTERMKTALRQPGTKGSYVEWAAECRDAVDKLNDAQAEIERLRGLVKVAYVEGYCDGKGNHSRSNARLAYQDYEVSYSKEHLYPRRPPMKASELLERTPLSTETPDESK